MLTRQQERRHSCGSSMFPPPVVLLLALGVSFVFLSIPGFWDWLYLDTTTGGTEWASSCISRNEWIYTALSSALLFMTFMVERTNTTLPEDDDGAAATATAAALEFPRRQATPPSTTTMPPPLTHSVTTSTGTTTSGDDDDDSKGSNGGYLLTTSQAKGLFVALNLFWLVLAMAATIDYRGGIVTSMDVSTWLGFIGAKAAWPALFDLVMVLFPLQRFHPMLHRATAAGRGGGLSVSFREAIPWHIWCGHAIGTWLTVHTVLLSVQYAIVTKSISTWWSLMVPGAYVPIYTQADVNFTGIISYVALLLLWLGAHPTVRAHYETFYILHVAMATVFVVFAHLHDYNTLFLVQPALAAWVADVYLRRRPGRRLAITTASAGNANGTETSPNTAGSYYNTGRDGIHNGERTGVAMEDDDNDDDNDDSNITPSGTLRITGHPASSVLCLEFSIPKQWSHNFLQPGMFIYLSTPKTDRGFPHPFSVSAIVPLRNSFTVHVKALGDYTSMLINEDLKPWLMMIQQQERLGEENNRRRQRLLADFGACHLPWYIEGPFGGNAAMTATIQSNNYSKRIFVAGGVGITGVASTIIQLQKTEDVLLLWWVRSTAELLVLQSCLADENNNTSTSLDDDVNHPYRDRRRHLLRIKVYISSNSSSAIPTEDPLLLLEQATEETELVSATTIITYRSKSLLLPPWQQQLLGVACSIGGMTLSLVMSRWLCCNRPIDDANGRRLHQCTKASVLVFLMRRSTAAAAREACQVCSTNHDADNDEDNYVPPCCTSPVCYYCFRGAHILVCLVMTPLFGCVIPRLIDRLLIQCRKRCCQHRRSPYSSLRMSSMTPFIQEELLEVEDDQPVSAEGYGTALCTDQYPSEQQQHTTKHLGTTTTTTASSYCQFSYIFRSASNDDSLSMALREQVGPDMAIVTCGSDTFVDVVRNEVQRQKHWNTRVYVVR